MSATSSRRWRFARRNRRPACRSPPARSRAGSMAGGERPIRIGIDLGGTKTEAIAIDGAGRELVRRRVPTPAGDYDAQLAAVRELVRGSEAEVGAPGTVGVGIPGTMSTATGLIKNANSTWLI